MKKWDEVIADASKSFEATGILDATANAEYLAAYVLHAWKRAEVRPFLRQAPTPAQLRVFTSGCERRLRGEPLQYIIGETEFYGVRLNTSPAALIPRPETEILVTEALAMIDRIEGMSRVLDIGTGTGAIALALASRNPKTNCIGIDISEAAIKLARSNKTRLGCSNVGFRVLDFPNDIAQCSGPFDLIVSNPPYIPLVEMNLLSDEIRTHEPANALTDNGDGFSFYEAIAANASALLSENGVVLVETEFKGAARVRAIFESHGLTIISTVRDLLGHERVVVAAFDRHDNL